VAKDDSGNVGQMPSGPEGVGDERSVAAGHQSSVK
jgi:hypothetical protein